MLNRYRSWITAAFALALVIPSLASAKPGEPAEKYWNPLGGSIGIMADVAELEPNNGIANAQLISCGDVLRPATIGVAADTDYVKFTVPAGTIITLGTDADGTPALTDTRIRLFDSNYGVLATDDDSGPGLYSLITYTTATGGTFYGGFAAYGATSTGKYKGFLTCTIPQPPPANDNCAGATWIECGNINIAGSTQFATADYSLLGTGCTGYTSAGKDVVYQINAGGGDVLNISYTSAADGSVYLLSTCGDVATCVVGADATVAGGAEVINYTFPASGVYYLVLDNYGTGAGGAFTLTGSLTCQVVPTNHKSWGTLKTMYR